MPAETVVQADVEETAEMAVAMLAVILAEAVETVVQQEQAEPVVLVVQMDPMAVLTVQEAEEITRKNTGIKNNATKIPRLLVSVFLCLVELLDGFDYEVGAEVDAVVGEVDFVAFLYVFVDILGNG